MKGLREVLRQYLDVEFSIRELNLVRLSVVHDFVIAVADENYSGKCSPLTRIICNDLLRSRKFDPPSPRQLWSEWWSSNSLL